jgi:hypothetical protein
MKTILRTDADLEGLRTLHTVGNNKCACMGVLYKLLVFNLEVTNIEQ